MSLKRKRTVIKFSGDGEKQKFLNWALGKSEPTPKINKAKNAMRLAQKESESRPKRSELLEKIEVAVLPKHLVNHSSTSSSEYVSRKRARRNRNTAKRKRNVTDGLVANYRRGPRDY
jgi:hypothetical protein